MNIDKQLRKVAKQIKKEGLTLEQFTETLNKYLKEPEPKKLPESWEELKTVEGHYITSDAIIEDIGTLIAQNDAKNTFKTEAQAKSALAMAQLSQLMSVYNDGWQPDWSDGKQIKYSIRRFSNKIDLDYCYSLFEFLVFKTEELRNHFFEHHEALIKQYFMID